MTAVRCTRSAGGLLLVGLCALAGCSAGSARTDYYASRSIILPAAEGDGSIVAIDAHATDGAWRDSLTFVPLSGDGDLADNR